MPPSNPPEGWKPPENWRPPSELNCHLPRPVRLTGGGIGFCLASLALIALALGVAARAVEDNRRAAASLRRMLAQGRETEALVTGFGCRSRVNWVSYRFIADGRIYRGSSRFPGPECGVLKVFSPIRVRYLLSNPSVNFPSDMPPSGLVPMAYVYTMCPLGVLFGLLPLRALWRRRRYLAGGRPAPAVVTRVDKRRHSEFTVHYEFPVGDGHMCRGSYSEVGVIPPPEGSVICVLCHPDNPSRYVRYPAGISLLRVAAARHG